MKFLATKVRDPAKGQIDNSGMEHLEFWMWVIPAPHLENVFITLPKPWIGPYPGGEPCIVAEVHEGFDDPDRELEQLHKMYPALPEKLLQFYIMQTVLALNKGDHQPAVGRRFRVFCNQSSATLQDVDSQNQLSLWTDLHTENYL